MRSLQTQMALSYNGFSPNPAPCHVRPGMCVESISKVTASGGVGLSSKDSEGQAIEILMVIWSCPKCLHIANRSHRALVKFHSAMAWSEARRSYTVP